MRKTVTVAALVLIFAACASTPQVASLSDKQLSAMSPSQVSAYYADQNKTLADNVLYNYGGDTYTAVESLTLQMNNDLTNLSKQKITRSQYNDGVRAIANKYQRQIDAAVKTSKINS